MTDGEKKRLDKFDYNVKHLLKQHKELKENKAQLEQLLKEEKEKNERLQVYCKQIEANYSNLKTATAISLNGSDVKDTKLRLSKLVREVDKCIALLNQ